MVIGTALLAQFVRLWWERFHPSAPPAGGFWGDGILAFNPVWSLWSMFSFREEPVGGLPLPPVALYVLGYGVLALAALATASIAVGRARVEG